MRSSPSNLLDQLLLGNRRIVTRQARVMSFRLPAPPTPTWYVIGSEIPFENNWEQYQTSGVFNTASFMKDDSGFVHLRGLIKQDQGNDPKTRAFTLPIGFRPARLEVHPVRWSGLSSEADEYFEAVSMFIHADGRVDFRFIDDLPQMWDYGAVEVPWLTLDSHRFKAS